MSIPVIAFLLSTASAWFMTGLIWFVQVVHYPQFGGVPSDHFCAYHRRHTRLTTLVVAVPMLVELGTAAWLIFQRPNGLPPWIVWASAALVGITSVSTAALQVPAHNRLALAFSPEIHRRLCTTNWIRTAAWSVRAIVMLYGVGRLIGV